MDDKYSDIDLLLNSLRMPTEDTLLELYDRKLLDLDVTGTKACKIMGLELRSVKKILDGSAKLLDVNSVPRLANFLDISDDKVIKLFLKAFAIVNPTNINTNEKKIDFIKENFDLSALKKVGIINSIRDFEHIEERLKKRLGIKSIFEYRKPSLDLAFSSGKFQQSNERTRAFWVQIGRANV